MNWFEPTPDTSKLAAPTGLRAAVPIDRAEVLRGRAATTGLFDSGVEQASLHEAANRFYTQGLKAEAAGLGDEAATAYAQAKDLSAQASLYASPVKKVEDIGGVGDFAQWATHGLGQGLRSTIPSIAGSALGAGAALLTRGLVPVGTGAFAGGAGVGYNQEMEAFAGEAAANPEIRATNTPEQIISNARGYGVGSGMLEAAGPAALAGKLAGKGAAGIMSAPKTIGMGMLTEGGTETSQSALQQTMQNNMVGDPNRGVDWSQALNEGAIGALTGGAMGTVGAGADAAWQYTNDAARLGVDGAKGALPYLKAGAQKAGEYAEKAGEYAKKGYDAAKPHMDDIREGYKAGGLGGAAAVAKSKIIEGAGNAADVIEGKTKEILGSDETKSTYKNVTGRDLEADLKSLDIQITPDMSDEQVIQFANENHDKAKGLAASILESKKVHGKLTEEDRRLLRTVAMGKGDDKMNRRVASVYKAIRDNENLEQSISDILKSGDKRDPKSRASRQLTEDDVHRGSQVKLFLDSIGVKDAQTQNVLSKLAEKGNNTLFNEAIQDKLLKRGAIDQDGLKILREIGMVDDVEVVAPKNRKERSRAKVAETAQGGAKRAMKMSDLWSRIDGYVAEGVRGTKYDTPDTKSFLTNKLGDLVSRVATGEATHDQILSLKNTLGEAIGEEAAAMVDIVSDMASTYQSWSGRGDAAAKIADLKNSVNGREKAALFTIDEMLHGKGSTMAAGDRRTSSTRALRQLTNAYLAGRKHTKESRIERMQSAYAQAERMRQEGDFKGAMKIENDADAEFDRDPFEGYNKLVEQHFGKGKTERVTSVVRAYLGEVNDAATGRKDGLGYAKPGQGLGVQDPSNVIEDENDIETNQSTAELASGMNGETDGDTAEVVGKAQNETGVHQQVSATGHGVYGARGISQGEQYPGGAVTTRATVEHASRVDGRNSAAAMLQGEVEAMNQGARVKMVSPVKWADDTAKRDGVSADILLNDMAKGQMEADAKRKEVLRRKLRGADEDQRLLITRELADISDRAERYKGVGGNGREFYSAKANNHLRVVTTAPATEGIIEADGDLIQRFRVGDEQYAANRWAAATGGDPKDFINSILSVTNENGDLIKIDFAGMVAEMMRRNQPGDITGLGEKNIEPGLLVDLRSAVMNVVTSIIYGDAVKHVDGNPFGADFAQMGDYTFHTDKFGKKGLNPAQQNWGFNPTKVAYRSPDTGVTLTFGQVFGTTGRKAAEAKRKKAMDDELSEAELASVVGSKPTRDGTIYDEKGNLYSFDPRELVRIMMRRHDMRADDILPVGQEADEISRELLGQLLLEGTLLLEQQGFRLDGAPGIVKATDAVIDRQNKLVINVIKEGLADNENVAFDLNTTLEDLRGFMQGQYEGAYDYRADKALVAQDKLEKKLEAAHKANNDYKLGKGERLDVLEAVHALEQTMKFGDDALTTKNMRGADTPTGTTGTKRGATITEGGQKTTLTNDTLSRLDENSHDNTEPLITDQANQFGGASFNSEKAKAPQTTVLRTVTGSNLDRDTLVKQKRKEWRDNRAAELRAERAEKRSQSAQATVTPVNFRTPNDYGGPAPKPSMISTTTATAQPLNAVDQVKGKLARQHAERKAKADALRAERAAKRGERNAPAPTTPESSPESSLETTGTSAEDLLAELSALPSDGTLIPKINGIAGRGGMPASRDVSKAANKAYGGYENWPTAVKRMVNKLERMENGGGPDGGGGGKSRASRQGQTSQQGAPSGDANSKTKDVAAAAAMADAERRLKDAVDAVIKDVVLDDDGNKVSGLYTPKSATTKALMQVARDVLSLRGSMAHENWHAVEDLLLELGPKGKHIVDTIHAAASKPETIDWIIDRLIERGENPENSAAIDQLNDPSERAAFLFQFFIETGGKMPVAPKARGYLSKIKDLLKKMLGIQDDLIKAGAFFTYFDKGTFAKEMNDAEKVLAGLGETTREKYAAKVGEAIKPLRKLANAAFGHAADRIRELDIPEYTDILERFQTGKKGSAGFMREHNARSYSFFNKFTRIVAGKDKLTPADEAKIAELVLEIETYKEAAGAGFDKRRKTVPPSLDPAKIEGSLDDFIHALKAWGGFPKDTKKADIDRIANEILLKGYHSGKHDVLEMHPEKFKKWLSEDRSKDAFVYIKKSTHEAEMARAFGDQSLDDLLAKGDEKADINGREMIRTYIAAAQGNAHLALSPQLRKLFGAITTGINLSILPFAVFSQMIEPLQLAFRKNDVASALNSTFRGLRDLPRTFKAVDAGAQKDQWEMMAADMGLIAEAQAVTMMSEIMNEVPMTGKLGKVNDLFFRYNGMEQWTRSMHVAATKNAAEFIKQHDKEKTDLGDKLLAELDLKRGSIPYRADGNVDHNDPAVRAAILRFVNESMAHPDAGSNTIWMNDARFALLAHLKRFTFAHSYYINGRIMSNIEDGNLRSLMPIAGMVPWMIAVDGIRDIVNPGEETYKNNWEASDYVAKSIERSSYYGRYGLGLDFMANVERGGSGIETAAPVAEMSSKIARGFGQGRGTDAIIDAMPVVGW